MATIKVLTQVMADGTKIYRDIAVVKCTPEQIAQTVKHLASVIKTIQEQQGLDIVLTDWTHSEPGDSVGAEPPMLMIVFNESFYHPVTPDDEEFPF